MLFRYDLSPIGERNSESKNFAKEGPCSTQKILTKKTTPHTRIVFRDSPGNRSVPKKESGHCQPPFSALLHPGTSSRRYDRADETTHSACAQAGPATIE